MFYGGWNLHFLGRLRIEVLMGLLICLVAVDQLFFLLKLFSEEEHNGNFSEKATNAMHNQKIETDQLNQTDALKNSHTLSRKMELHPLFRASSSHLILQP